MSTQLAPSVARAHDAKRHRDTTMRALIAASRTAGVQLVPLLGHPDPAIADAAAEAVQANLDARSKLAGLMAMLGVR